jgi:hypothetical protein
LASLAYRPSVILIEDKASGTQLIQDLIEEGIHAVKAFKPEYDKVMRLLAQTATIENGFVYLPQEAHWLPDYLHELTTFPTPNMTTRWIRRRKRLPGPSNGRPGGGSWSTIASSMKRCMAGRIHARSS